VCLVEEVCKTRYGAEWPPSGSGDATSVHSVDRGSVGDRNVGSPLGCLVATISYKAATLHVISPVVEACLK
jgi:hypothetical protein